MQEHVSYRTGYPGNHTGASQKGTTVEFAEALAMMATKVSQQKASILTEEATKNALIMPFISTVLGYDVFDPMEVVPEFTADVGLKRGEKVDYAIVHQGQVQILIECKPVGAPLSLENASQLYRYFSVTNARIAVLTNGEVYHLYTDLDAPNRMDAKPFLVLDLSDIDATLIPELQKLRKDVFNLDSIISSAGELKYVGEIKRAIAAQFREPGAEWVRIFTACVYEGSFTQRVREQFTPLVMKAAQQYLTEQVNNRLSTALGAAPAVPVVEEPTSAPTDDEAPEAPGDIVTTEEELEAFHIIRAIVCGQVKAHRVTYRDAKTYCAVMLDDNNRKSLARLRFNGSQKYLGLLSEDRTETRHAIDGLEDIYAHADHLRAAVDRLNVQ